ncbi:MAG: hypothetical protein M3Y91_14595 [Actinomycetota bacterium]|nr:hypothetical protein [Actinomycetota bacterium]
MTAHPTLVGGGGSAILVRSGGAIGVPPLDHVVGSPAVVVSVGGHRRLLRAR